MNNQNVPDKIKDRLQKLKRLAEQGYKGEALAAKRTLEAMLEKYGLTLDSLCDDKAEWRWIKVGSNSEVKKILHQCHFKIIDKSRTSYKEYKGEVGFELTPAQYADLMSLFEFHCSQFKKERSRFLKNLMNAYIHKHEIFNASDDEGGDDKPKKKNDADLSDLRAALALVDAMEDVSYHKQLELK